MVKKTGSSGERFNPSGVSGWYSLYFPYQVGVELPRETIRRKVNYAYNNSSFDEDLLKSEDVKFPSECFVKIISQH